MQALDLLDDCLSLAAAAEVDALLALTRKAMSADQLARALRIENALAATLGAMWNDRARAAVRSMLEVVATRGKPAADPVIDVLRQHFSSFERAVSPVVDGAMRASYTLGKETGAARGVQGGFWLIDRAAQDWLVRDQLYWIGTTWDRTLGSQIAEVVRQTVVDAGESTPEAAKLLRQRIGPLVGGNRTDAYWRIVAGAANTRARAFGAVQGLVDSGATTYTLRNPMDESTSAICRRLDGTSWTVDRAVSQRDRMMLADSPDAAKAVAPWLPEVQITGATADELADLPIGLPPFHGNCRTVVEIGDDEVFGDAGAGGSEERTRDLLNSAAAGMSDSDLFAAQAEAEAEAARQAAEEAERKKVADAEAKKKAAAAKRKAAAEARKKVPGGATVKAGTKTAPSTTRATKTAVDRETRLRLLETKDPLSLTEDEALEVYAPDRFLAMFGTKPATASEANAFATRASMLAQNTSKLYGEYPRIPWGQKHATKLRVASDVSFELHKVAEGFARVAEDLGPRTFEVVTKGKAAPALEKELRKRVPKRVLDRIGRVTLETVRDPGKVHRGAYAWCRNERSRTSLAAMERRKIPLSHVQMPEVTRERRPTGTSYGLIHEHGHAYANATGDQYFGENFWSMLHHLYPGWDQQGKRSGTTLTPSTSYAFGLADGDRCFVSRYASTKTSEDFAETFEHVLDDLMEGGGAATDPPKFKPATPARSDKVDLMKRILGTNEEVLETVWEFEQRRAAAQLKRRTGLILPEPVKKTPTPTP